MLEKVKLILKESENKDTILRRVASFLPSMDPRYVMIKRAHELAEETFWKEQRETGEEYFAHLRGVFLIQYDYLRIRNYVLLTSGFLHDTTEHRPKLWPIDRIRLEFGDEVALLQNYLSKPSHEEYPSEEERLAVYHRRFKYAPRDFFLVKLPDRLHNLLTMWNCSPEKIVFKVEETRKYYLPYAEEHQILIHEIEEAIEELESKMPLGD